MCQARKVINYALLTTVTRHKSGARDAITRAPCAVLNTPPPMWKAYK